MKTPHVIVIAIVVVILGFLVFYSQQHEMTNQAKQQETTVSAPASAGPVPAQASGEK
jgi:Tfp pilus assembly protein PilO